MGRYRKGLISPAGLTKTERKDISFISFGCTLVPSSLLSFAPCPVLVRPLSLCPSLPLSLSLSFPSIICSSLYHRCPPLLLPFSFLPYISSLQLSSIQKERKKRAREYSRIGTSPPHCHKKKEKTRNSCKVWTHVSNEMHVVDSQFTLPSRLPGVPKRRTALACMRMVAMTDYSIVNTPMEHEQLLISLTGVFNEKVRNTEA